MNVVCCSRDWRFKGQKNMVTNQQRNNQTQDWCGWGKHAGTDMMMVNLRLGKHARTDMIWLHPLNHHEKRGFQVSWISMHRFVDRVAGHFHYRSYVLKKEKQTAQ